MKKLKYAIVLILIINVCYSGLNKHGMLKVKIVPIFYTEQTDENFNNFLDGIKFRIEKYSGDSNITYEVQNKSIVVSFPSNMAKINQFRKLLTINLKVEFIEEYTLNKEIKSNICSLLSLRNIENSNSICCIDEGDTVTIEKITTLLKNDFKLNDFQILSSISYDHNNHGYQLYCLKRNNNIINLSDKNIVSVDTIKNGIEILFDETGKKLLKELSSKNIGKNIFIIYDNKVIVNPNVNDTIYDRMILTGNMNKEAKINLKFTLSRKRIADRIELIDIR